MLRGIALRKSAVDLPLFDACVVECDTKSSIIIQTLRAFRLAIMVDLEAWRLGVSEAKKLRCLAKLSGLRTRMVFDRLRIIT